MMNQGPFDNENNQFMVSYELLQLFKWLLEHEQETLKKLVCKALRNGLYEHIHTVPINYEIENQEDLQQNVIDFFALFEILLYELVNESEVKKILERNLIPAIDHIDSTVYDHDTVALSIAKATSAFEDNPQKDPKEVLCKELLKRWKPAKKISTH